MITKASRCDELTQNFSSRYVPCPSSPEQLCLLDHAPRQRHEHQQHQGFCDPTRDEVSRLGSTYAAHDDWRPNLTRSSSSKQVWQRQKEWGDSLACSLSGDALHALALNHAAASCSRRVRGLIAGAACPVAVFTCCCWVRSGCVPPHQQEQVVVDERSGCDRVLLGHVERQV